MIKKFCYHGNVTSSFSSLFQPHISLANKEMSDFEHRISKLVNPTQKIVSKVPILVNLLSITGEGIWRQTLRAWQAWQPCLQRIFRRTFPSFKHIFFVKDQKTLVLREYHDKTRTLQTCHVCHKTHVHLHCRPLLSAVLLRKPTIFRWEMVWVLNLNLSFSTQNLPHYYLSKL